MAAVLQELFVDDSFGSGTVLTTAAASLNFTVGSTIEVWLTCGNNASNLPLSVVDSAGQHYTNKKITFEATVAQSLALYVFENNASTAKLTFTVTYSVAESGKGLWIKELGGVTTPTSYDNAVITSTPTPGTGANAVTTTTITPASPPVLCSIIAMECNIGDGSDLAAGTGYALGSSGWLFGGSSALAKSASKTLSSATATAGTFTAATHGGSGKYLVGLAMYDATGGSGTINTKSITETSAIIDAETKQRQNSRAILDAWISSELATKVRQNSRSIIDPWISSDLLSKLSTGIKVLLEAFATSDSLSSFKVRFRVLNEAVTVNDSLSRVMRQLRTITESFAVDLDGSSAVNLSYLGDPITLADVLTHQGSVRIKLLSEAIAIIDSLTATVVTGGARNIRSIVEAITVTDSLASALRKTRALSDVITLSDLVSSRLTFNRAVVEALSTADLETISATRNVFKTLLEALSLTDTQTVTGTRNISKQLLESFATVDQLAKTLAMRIQLLEAIAIFDIGTPVVTRFASSIVTLTSPVILGSE